jgi:hypothetical protein
MIWGALLNEHFASQRNKRELTQVTQIRRLPSILRIGSK